MEITTSQEKTGGARLVVNCDHSSVASSVELRIYPALTTVSVAYLNGAEWQYNVPTSILLDFLGESSVGRFINVMKRESHHSLRLR